MVFIILVHPNRIELVSNLLKRNVKHQELLTCLESGQKTESKVNILGGSSEEWDEAAIFGFVTLTQQAFWFTYKKIIITWAGFKNNYSKWNDALMRK
jgi:hypothetical protein